MRYRWQAADADGRIRRGAEEAANPADLERRLRVQGLSLIASRLAPARGGSFWRRVSRRDLIAFTFHLEQLARAGVPLLGGLADLRDAMTSPALHQAIVRMIEDVEGGQRFSEALARHPTVFDPVYVSLVRAGEEGGQLPTVLASLTEALKWQDEIASETKKLVAYPAFVGVLVLGVIGFLMVHLVPQMVDFLKGAGQVLPFSTRLLIATSHLVASYGLALLASLALVIAALPFAIRRHASLADFIDRLRLRMPLLGPIAHRIVLARFSQCFAMLYAAGVPILQALAITRDVVQNRVVAAALDRIQAQIRDGQGVAASFERERLFPPLVLRMLRVGEQSGALDTALANVTYFYNRDVRESVARLQTMIEPALTVVLGALLFWVMSALLGPIFDTLGKLR
ncbi:type II secretion system F family protein [Chitinolyticbacter meiyuanensis]|uniref:type II secretion system F family protein n=1 Tax=Chitinolyticbacter meiyuanensis TaxID=682798 RepID=UPI0011E5B079|nr:type II secretion system F family protein [Chitinolyticbacter meiyuanensis]